MKIGTINGAALTDALKQMGKAPRRLLGSAFWCFGDEVIVSWTTYEHSLDAHLEVPSAGPFMVPGDVMAQLCRRVALKGEVTIEWDATRARLQLGSHSLPAIQVAPERPFVLALDARPRELLRQALVQSPESLAEAGYGTEAEEIMKRWQRSLDAAHEALAWTGLTKGDIEAALLGDA